MTPEVQARYTPAMRDAVAHAAGGEPAKLTDLGGFESFVHELEVDGARRIVKATWSGRRPADAMQAELDFVSYLADHDAPVCRPLPLRGGALLDTIPCEGGGWHVTAWERAPGGKLPRTEFTPEVFVPWGALVGRLHRLGARYAAVRGPDARPTWREEFDAIAVGEHNPPDMQAAYRTLREEITALPRDPAWFGPMHTDLHHGNIHWHDGAVHVFDFEDMIDFWFVSDLAVVLYYGVLGPGGVAERQARFDAFRPALMEGYATEYELPQAQREAIPLFLSVREQVMRAAVLRSLPEAERTDSMREYLAASGERIRRGEPALGLRW